jgi:hypothetical protein
MHSKLPWGGRVKVTILCPAHAAIEDIELPSSYGTGSGRRFQGEVPCAQQTTILEIDVNLDSTHVASVRFARTVAQS